MVAEPVFVDTNVLVYASRNTSVFHGRAAAVLAALRAAGDPLWISRQILREYLATVTRPHGTAPALTSDVAVADVHLFAQLFDVVEDSPAVTAKLLELITQFPTAGRQIHDANIVATMVVHGLKRLLTFNVSDFQRFSSLIDLEPA
jgi:predicted nucleic acid-binding protein